MKKLAIIYHGAHGHTEHIATHVLGGARSVPNTEVHLLSFDGYLLGSPTCLGGVTSQFKACMDAAGRLWRMLHRAAGVATAAQRREVFA